MNFKLLLMFLIGFLGFCATELLAEPAGTIRIEGHAFSATTMRPLPGVIVEIWGFFKPEQQMNTVSSVETDEGGFFWTENPYTFTGENGKDTAIGYAFAFICRYGQEEKVQIQSLYSSLLPNQVYQRNVYIQVPANITKCDVFGF